MYHSAQERLDIGRKVFNHQISKEEEAREYGVSMQSIINYVKEYMRSTNIPAVPKAAEAIGYLRPKMKNKCLQNVDYCNLFCRISSIYDKFILGFESVLLLTFIFFLGFLTEIIL